MLLVVAGWMVLTGAGALGQSAAPAPTATAPATATAATPPADPTMGITFDVVSIRPTTEGLSHIVNPVDGDGITIEHSTMLEIVRWNFNMTMLRQDQLQGVPDWFTTDNYEIRAKVAESDIAAWKKLGEGGHRLVFRKFLADRFRFAWHFSDVDSPIYNMVIAKGGLKIKEAGPDEASPFAFKTADGSTNADGTRVAYKGAGITMRPAPDGYPMYVMQQTHMSSFAKGFLSGGIAGRPVVDKTGLTGAYNFSLEFAYEQGASAAAAEDSGPSRPTIFTALQEQLGLKLEPARGPVSMMVVDHIERPAED
jgi:uncharacterized protein (TIGR03435 family)